MHKIFQIIILKSQFQSWCRYWHLEIDLPHEIYSKLTTVWYSVFNNPSVIYHTSISEAYLNNYGFFFATNSKHTNECKTKCTFIFITDLFNYTKMELYTLQTFNKFNSTLKLNLEYFKKISWQIFFQTNIESTQTFYRFVA